MISKSRNSGSVKPHNIFLLVLGFFVVIYSLVYSGVFSVDDEHILSVQALSLAFDDNVNFSRVIGNERVFSYSRYTDPYAAQAMNIEPAQALIGSLLARLADRFGLGVVQSLFLLNIWVTATTAALVYLIVTTMHYPQRVGLVMAVFFGLGTMAFPYSRTYFRDPLAMMFLTGAWFFMVALITGDDHPNNRKRTIMLFIGLGCSLVAGILSKNILLLAVPVILFELGNNRKRIMIKSEGQHRKGLRWIVVGCGLLIILMCWFFLVPGVPLLARFTPEYYSFLVKFFINTPRPNFLEAVTGPLISPGKSIFLFSPILFLSLWGLIFNFKKSWPAWVFLFFIIIAQALFYDSEWAGHINWGARYLLPSIPLLLLTAVPLVDRMLKTWQGKTVLIGMGTLSLLVQLLGVLVPVRDYYVAMFSGDVAVNEWSTVWQARHSIFNWDISYLFGGQPVDLALLRAPEKIFTILLVSIGIVGCVFLSMKVEKLKKFSGLILVLCLGLNFLLLSSYKNDPAYYRSRADLQTANQYLTQNIQTSDVVLIRSYGTPAWNYEMNWTGLKIHWTALPYFYPVPSLMEKYLTSQNPQDALSTQTVTLLNESLQANGTVWLVSPSDSEGADLKLEKTWLTSRASSAECKEFKGEKDNTEVCRFIFP